MQNQSSYCKNTQANLQIILHTPPFEPGVPFYPSPLSITEDPIREQISFLHYHNSLEIGLCLEGSGFFLVENAMIPYKAPCASIIYRGQVHIAKSNANVVNKWYFININDDAISFGWPDYYKIGHSLKPIISQGDDFDIISLVSALCDELRERKSGYLRCAASLVAAILCKHARYSESGNTSSLMRVLLEDISPAITYIANHYNMEFTVEFLAALCSMSTPTLRRKFNDAIGTSPLNYLQQTRIEAAKELLSGSDKSMLEISETVGYDSLSSFNRQFRKVVGMSPSQFKKQDLVVI